MELKNIKDLPDELFDYHHNLTDQIYLDVLTSYHQHSPEQVLMAIGSVHAVMIADFIRTPEDAIRYAKAAAIALEKNLIAYLAAQSKIDD